VRTANRGESSTSDIYSARKSLCIAGELIDVYIARRLFKDTGDAISPYSEAWERGTYVSLFRHRISRRREIYKNQNVSHNETGLALSSARIRVRGCLNRNNSIDNSYFSNTELLNFTIWLLTVQNNVQVWMIRCTRNCCRHDKIPSRRKTLVFFVGALDTKRLIHTAIANTIRL